MLYIYRQRDVIYIDTYMYVSIYIYIHTHTWRERQRESNKTNMTRY